MFVEDSAQKRRPLTSSFWGVFVAVVSLGAALSTVPTRSDPQARLDTPLDLWEIVPPQFALGYQGFMASLLWVDQGFRYADIAYDQVRDARFSARMERVLLLDPDWIEPYETGSLMLLDRGIADSSRAYAILRRGADRFSYRWQLRIYAVMVGQDLGVPTSELATLLEPLLKANGDSVPEYARELALSFAAGASGEQGVAKARRLALLYREPLAFSSKVVLARQIVRTLDDAGILSEASKYRTSDSLVAVLLQPETDMTMVLGLLDRLGSTAPAQGSSKNR
jgi:hypothetical protein